MTMAQRSGRAEKISISLRPEDVAARGVRVLGIG
jgi:hypothetical protein